MRQRRLDAPVALAALALSLAAAPPAHAVCDVVPQPEVLFQGATGSLNRVFAGPGERIEISLDTAGCEAGGAAFSTTNDVTLTATDFASDLMGWTSPFGTLVHDPAGGNPGGFAHGTKDWSTSLIAPVEFQGDWIARGVTSLAWDHKVVNACGGTYVSPPLNLVILTGPGGQAHWRLATPAEISALPLDGTWTDFDLPISTAGPTGNWVLNSGTWQGLLENVETISIRGSLLTGNCDEYGLDNIALSQVQTFADVTTLIFEPPDGPANAVVVTQEASTCSLIADDLEACEAELGGGTATCVHDPAIAFDPSRYSVPLPSTPYAGPVTVAVSPGGQALPCELATLRCADPGAPGNLKACIDEFYARDGSCGTEAVNRHEQFPGFTALPPRNDFEGICDSPDPSLPCNNSDVDVRLTTDLEGNLLVPIDWRGVLVPGTLPIPRLVRAGSSIAAFGGAPPEPTQVPGAPIRVPGLGFLQSFSPKGLRVDPLFNPLVSAESPDTELFGSADAEFGVIRVLRRSPKFRQCAAGDRAGLPCLADFECPASQCVEARCRGGSNPGAKCRSDAACSGGECGAPLFDFSDRYSAGGTGPILLTSAQYTAEAQNPAAIDGLVATDDVFMFVRAETLEAKDLNGDGDMLDDTVVSVRRADDGIPRILGSTLDWKAVGPASPRVRQFPFAFPAISVEDDVVAMLVSEPDDGGDNTGDGDDWDAALRVLRMEPDGIVHLVGSSPATGTSPAADGLSRIGRESLKVSDGLVFFRRSERDSATRQTTLYWKYEHSYPSFSADGRYMGFVSPYSFLVEGDTNGCEDVFVLDRDADADGIYDEANDVSFARVSVTSSGEEGTYPTCDPQGFWGIVRGAHLSASGRHVAFTTWYSLDGSPTGAGVYLHDRDANNNGIFDEDPSLVPGAISTTLVHPNAMEIAAPVLSADGRWLAYLPYVGGGEEPFSEPFVRDRDVDQDGIFDEPGAVADIRLTDAVPGGMPEPGWVESISITPDGRFAAFFLQLDAQTTQVKLYVVDRDADRDGVYDEPGQAAIQLVSVTTAGEPVIETDGKYLGFHIHWSYGPAMSEDGRRILFFAMDPESYGPGGEDPGSKVILHDRDADGNGIFDEPGGIESRRVARSQDSRSPTPLLISSASLSPDGRVLMLGGVEQSSTVRTLDRIDLDTGVASAVAPAGESFYATGLGAQAATLSYRVGAHLVMDGSNNAGSGDLSGDGDRDDVILAVADGRAAAPVAVTALGPAGRVAVSAGNAIFLRPEAADGSFLNSDLDAMDHVVHLWRNRQGGTAVNLGVAAERVAIAEEIVAALVSEAGEGALLNGDSDMHDWVVHVNDLATATAGNWTSLFLAADDVQARGSRVAFTIPEIDQGTSLNGDGDLADRVLRVYDVSTHQFLTLVDEQGVPLPGVGPAVDDFVLGDQIVAFRVNEFAQGQNLNGVAPPIPGGVADGDLFDSVMHVASLTTGKVYNSRQAAIPCPVEACDPRIPYRVLDTKVTYLTLEAHQGSNDLDQSGDAGTGLVLQHFNPDPLAAGGSLEDANDLIGGTLAGVCTGSAEACASDLDCTGGGICYLPPGGCLLDTGIACSPATEDDTTDDCTPSQFCAPVLGNPGVGTCHEFQGPCLDDGQCTPPAFCTDDGANAEELFAAFGEDGDGRQRYPSQGRCSDGDGACANDGDCNSGATCNQDVTVTATAADFDADGLADPIDNCPDHPNGDQRDTDGDGAGDACDRQSCGNGIQEYGETCDHAAQNGLDGVCDAACAYVGLGTACSDGLDNDGDGTIDLADAGCADAADGSERDSLKACDDGRDNDGDYRIDFSAVSPAADDPGCGSPTATREDPQCSDGIDNDSDGKRDWNGAGIGVKDPQCAGPAGPKEGKSCGLGFELALLAPVLARIRRRRRERPAG